MKKNSSKKSLLYIAIAFCLIAGFGMKIQQSNTDHVSASVNEMNVGYLSVPVYASDTLTSIAKEYYSDEFGSVQNYMDEIRSCNSMKTDTIYAGGYIVVPVYHHPEAEQNS